MPQRLARLEEVRPVSESDEWRDGAFLLNSSETNRLLRVREPHRYNCQPRRQRRLIGRYDAIKDSNPLNEGYAIL